MFDKEYFEKKEIVKKYIVLKIHDMQKIKMI